MPKRYQNHSPQDWEQIMSQYAASGLSQKAFCQRESLAPSTFSKWRKQLGLAGAKSLPAKATADFKPLSCFPLPTATPLMDSGGGGVGGWDVELALGNGMTLRIRDLG